MRMWMVNPKILCRRHLLGEHVETHMFGGALRKKMSMLGYVQNNLFEPRSLLSRHNRLAEEMKNRGMIHKSKLRFHNSRYLPPLQRDAKVNKKSALKDLLSRCPECSKRYKSFKKGK